MSYNSLKFSNRQVNAGIKEKLAVEVLAEMPLYMFIRMFCEIKISILDNISM